jgi:hypothetical protein
MSGAEGPSRMTRSTKERTKRWHEKRMRKKECDIGDKMLMNSSSKESFKQEEKTTTSHLPFSTWCDHAPIIKIASYGKWSSFSS